MAPRPHPWRQQHHQRADAFFQPALPGPGSSASLCECWCGRGGRHQSDRHSCRGPGADQPVPRLAPKRFRGLPGAGTSQAQPGHLYRLPRRPHPVRRTTGRGRCCPARRGGHPGTCPSGGRGQHRGYCLSTAADAFGDRAGGMAAAGGSARAGGRAGRWLPSSGAPRVVRGVRGQKTHLHPPPPPRPSGGHWPARGLRLRLVPTSWDMPTADSPLRIHPTC